MQIACNVTYKTHSSDITLSYRNILMCCNAYHTKIPVIILLSVIIIFSKQNACTISHNKVNNNVAAVTYCSILISRMSAPAHIIQYNSSDIIVICYDVLICKIYKYSHKVKHIVNYMTVSNRCILICTMHLSSHITHHNNNIIVSYPNDLFTI
jgi:hypothetical protein